VYIYDLADTHHHHNHQPTGSLTGLGNTIDQSEYAHKAPAKLLTTEIKLTTVPMKWKEKVSHIELVRVTVRQIYNNVHTRRGRLVGGYIIQNSGKQ
jgi:hypothetical protein